MTLSPSLKRVLSSWIIVAILASQTVRVDLSQSASPVEHWNVVAILADEAAYSDPTDYDGLHSEYSTAVPATTLKARIDRYAEAVQATMPKTKVLVVRTQPDETPENIMHVLQRLYFEGDGSESSITQLSGVILIGEVPIPVVTKNGNRYLSLLPYTDFEDPVYLFNATKGDFERNDQSEDPAPEVWHGVIAPPLSGEDGRELLAKYFDKNFLFRQGHEEFRDFDQKMLFADTVAEKKVLNRPGVDAYERFTDHFEEIAYNRYTKDLAQTLYEDVNGKLEDADGEDNDGDGLIDEDPTNAQDDDGDGILDEDEGDPLEGIDNDGDCWALPASQRDSNGDGRDCHVDDTNVDEDGTQDNNNDGDLLSDEDRPGDDNDDGCPGRCGKDEDGDSEDWDGDDFPNGFEIEVLDSNPRKKRSPSWIRWSAVPAAEKTVIKSMYTDEIFPSYESSCFLPVPGNPPPVPLINPFLPPRLLPPFSLPPIAASSYFDDSVQWNPNGLKRDGELCGAMSPDNANDDDEDGRFDEDTEDDNDADSDGLIDEDRAANPLTSASGSLFDELPDIQSKKIIDRFFKRYPEMFKRTLGLLNEWTDSTGRYVSSYLTADGQDTSDRETIIGLIGKRDQYVEFVLKAANDVFESVVDDLIEAEELAQEIPMIGAVTVGFPGVVNFLTEDSEEELTVPLPALTIPKIFLNFNPLNPMPPITGPEQLRTYVYGKPAAELQSVGECSLYRGSYDPDGDNQLVKGLRVFDYRTGGQWEDEEVNDEPVYGGATYAGCYGNFAENPEYCYPELSELPVRSQAGTKLVEDDSIDVDYRSCFNFRDLDSFFGNPTSPGYFFFITNPAIPGPAGVLSAYNELLEDVEDGDGIDPTDPHPILNTTYDRDNDGDYDDDDALIQLGEYIAILQSAGASGTPYTHPDDMDLVDRGTLPSGYYLTLGAVFDRLGIDKNNRQEIGDFFLTAPATVNVTFPQWDHVEDASIGIQRWYVAEPFPPATPAPLPPMPFTADPNGPGVVRISSILKHVEPIDSTINKQLAAGFSEALPIDDPRYVTFQNKDSEYTRIDYPNVYDATTWAELEAQLSAVEASVVEGVPGAESSEGFLTGLIGEHIFEEQMEDALAWDRMNVDEKHKWVLEHYLTPEKDAHTAEPADGFETLYLVADGEADRLNMSFYAKVAGDDEDWEYNNPETPTPPTEEEALALNAPEPVDAPGSYDPGDTTSNHVSWFPFVWIYDMVVWVDDLVETVANTASSTIEEGVEGFGFELACGGAPAFPVEEGQPAPKDSDYDGIPDDRDDAPRSMDSDHDGVADGAAATENISLVWNNSHLLRANGTDVFDVTVRTLDATGAFNAEDSFSRVELRVTNGEKSVIVLDSQGAEIVGGTATLRLSTTDVPGGFTLQAIGVSDNIEGVLSNGLTLQSRSEHLKLSTYTKELVTQESIYRSEPIEDVLILDEAEEPVAVVESATGLIRLFNPDVYELAVRSGTSTQPTRIDVVGAGDTVVATYSLQPDVEQIVVENSSAAMSGTVNDVRLLDRNPQDEWTLESLGEDVVVHYGSQSIALVKPDGRITIKPGFVATLELGLPYAGITNPHLHFTLNLGERILFDMVVGSEGRLIDVSVTNPEEVSWMNEWKRWIFSWVETARAAVEELSRDFDGDTLNDLTEWILGTDLKNVDTDGDTYADNVELDNGFDPLSSGQALFADFSPAHEAYTAVLDLFKRGIVGGYADRTFRPNFAITREEFTKLNLGASCVDCTRFAETVREEIDREYASHEFPDTNISPDLFYCVAYSRNEELISGYKGGDFAGYYLPKNTMSRAEATKVLLETAGISVPDVTDLSSPWYTNTVAAAQERELYPAGVSVVQSWLEAPITRAEFAMMVQKVAATQDCRTRDTDGDGLPDNFELYNSGTNPLNPDTDYGGVNDYIEVVNNTNAMSNPADDSTIEGGAPVEVEEPIDLGQKDSDDDGLLDAEEASHNTDPFDSDTDDGGITDFEEVLMGTDPLDDSSERGQSDFGKSGAKVSGLHLSRDSVFAVQKDDVQFENKLFTQMIPADGSSKLFLRAQMVGEDGRPIEDDDISVVEFIAVDPQNAYAEVLRTQVRVQRGIAETEILASTLSGYFDVTARIVPEELPTEDVKVYVYPGDPASVELTSTSRYLKSGGLNKTTVRLVLKDKFGNLANRTPHELTLTVDGPGEVAVRDEDAEQVGVQATVYEGAMLFDLVSGMTEGTARVTATLQDLTGSVEVGVYDNIALKIMPKETSLPADGEASTPVMVWAVLNNANEPLDGFNGEVSFSLVDPGFGSVSATGPLPLVNGATSTVFSSSTLAGTGYLTAAMVGLNPATVPLTLLPGAPTRLEITASSDLVRMGEPEARGTELVTVKSFDRYDNFVFNDVTTPVALRVTPATQRFGSLTSSNATLSNGESIFTVTAGSLTGPIHVVASSPGLISGTLELNNVMELQGPEFSEIQPDVLFGSLLGGPFGDITQDNYLGGWFTFEGSTEASISLLSDPEPRLRLAHLDSQGKLSILDGNAVTVSLLPSNSETLPLRFLVRDRVGDRTLAEGTIVPSVKDFFVLPIDGDLSAAKEDGFHVQLHTDNDRYEVRTSATGEVSLLEQRNEIVRFQSNGQVQVFDPNYSLALNERYDSFAFDVVIGGASLATILWKQNFDQDVIRLDPHFEWEDFALLAPGVYTTSIDSTTFGMTSAYSGNSSANPKGVYVVDKTEGLPTRQLPGLGRTSLEAAQQGGGVGFDGDNKFMLALSDGMTVGEAHQFYSSDIGVVLGDPTIRLSDSNPLEPSETGFTQGIGRLLIAGSETVQDVTPVDYNTDGLTDLLVAFENGVVDVLENTESYPRFRDRGALMNLPNGIISMADGDFNQDGQTDLVIATQDSCLVGEICVYLYENFDANFVRRNLNLEIDGSTLKQIEAVDLNNDDYPDLLASDINGSILIFYNDEGNILTAPETLGNLGIQVDEAKNLVEELLVHHAGMPVENRNTPADDAWFKEIPIPAPDGYGNAGEKFGTPTEGLATGGFDASLLTDAIEGADEVSPSKITNTVEFIYADLDPATLNSTKFGTDLNAGIINDGDELKYTLRVANGGSSELTDLAVNDVVSSLLTVDYESFSCEASAGSDCSQLALSKTSQNVRPFVVSGLNIAAGGYVEISYRATVAGVHIPSVKLFTGTNLDPALPSDSYIDVAASPEDNPTGQVVYFYSNGTYNENGVKKINYVKQTSTPSPVPRTSALADLGIDLTTDTDGDGTPDDLQGDTESGPPTAAMDLYSQQTEQDNDGDGLNNLWDDVNGNPSPENILVDVAAGATVVTEVTNMVGGVIESLIAEFSCSGGCIASPVNISFLTPGPINLFGIPITMMDMAHIPVFAAVGPTPFVWPPSPYQSSSAIRIYVSITTTLGFTISVCVGAYLGGQCWTFPIPLFQALGVCDAINGAIADALSKASSAISEGTNKIMSLAGNIPGANVGGRNESGGLSSYNMGSYAIAADSGSGNSRVPGFPKPFAEWLRKQAEEVVNKLTDLPDIYFYYPDPQSIIGPIKNTSATVDKVESADLRGLDKILTVLNSFPLIQIETQEVYFKIPAITADEIEKMKNDMQQWLLDLQNQWSAVQKNWENIQYADAREEVETMLTTIEKNLETLEDYKNFPRELLQWRSIEAVYIKQIICYLDAIINNLVGWVTLNKQRVEQWIQAIYDTKKAIKSWQKIFQLAVDYQESCDQCTTDRMSLFDLLAKLFIFIPEPPIIQIPRWPDIILDLSQIQAGLTVLWPEIKFQTEPVILPSLPRIRLPQTPNINDLSSNILNGTSNFSLPEIPLLPPIPRLPELPKLPGIPIPDLPDIPPPPKIPQLPQPAQTALTIASGLIKILCLLQSGIIPSAETSLKTTVEDMTGRPLSPVLPLDLSVNFQTPPISIDFVDQIEVIAYLNLNLNFDGIVRAVELAADAANDLMTDLTQLANDGLETAGDAVDEAMDAPLDALEDAQSALPSLLNDLMVTEEAKRMLANPYVQPYISEWEAAVRQMEVLAQEQEAYNLTVPKEHRLVATQQTLALTNEDVEQRFAEIQTRYFSGSLETLDDSALSQLRTDLLANVTDSLEANDSLATMLADNTLNEWDAMTRWIATTENAQGFSPDTSAYLAADHDETPNVFGTQSAFDRLRKNVIETFSSPNGEVFSSDVEDLDRESARYLAEVENDSSSTASGLAEPQILNEGLFIYNEAEEVNERLVAYTGEADAERSHLIFMDVEGDGDDDVVYGYDSNVYLKENYTVSETPEYEEDAPRIVELASLMPEAPSVDLFRTKSSGNRGSEVSWRAAANDVLGYEMKTVDALNDFEKEEPLITRHAQLLSNFQPAPDEEGTIEANEEPSLVVPPAEMAPLSVKAFDGTAVFKSGSRLHTVVNDSGEMLLKPADIVHALKDASVTLSFAEEAGTLDIELSENAQFTVPTDATGAITLRVTDGRVEVVSTKISDEIQEVEKGMMIAEDDRLISTENVDLRTTSLTGRFDTTYAGATEFFWSRLNAAEAPSMELALDNGDYYAQLRALLPDGRRGTWGERQLFSPQICGDTNLPYPNAGSVQREIPVFKKIILDGSGSFDSDSEIVKFYWDTDLDSDDDEDGDPTNDQNFHHDANPLADADGDGLKTNDWDDPLMTAGPWDAPGNHSFKLWVEDEARNRSGTTVAVKVFVPDISISSVAGATGEVIGEISVEESDIPFVIARERDGVFELIETPSADSLKKYYTDENGAFDINDLELAPQWLIYNSLHEAVAEIDRDSGRVDLLEATYSVQVFSAERPWPTRLVLLDPNGRELMYIFIVPDSAVDVTIDPQATVYDAETTRKMIGVHAAPVALPSTMRFETIAAFEPLFGGGVALVNEQGQREAVIDTDGSVYRLSDGLELGVLDVASVNENADQEGATPIVLTLGRDGDAWIHLYIAPRAGTPANFVTAEELGLGQTFAFDELDAEALATRDSDEDGISDRDELKSGFNPYNANDADLDSDNDGLTNVKEAEYGTLPRTPDTDGDGVTDGKEVQAGSSPTVVDASYFVDVPYTDSLYKKLFEFVQLGIINGYIEKDGLYFRPNQRLTRAEYTKILLAMMCIEPRESAFQSPPVFNDIPFVSQDLPWYYPITKESYLQGFIYGYLGERAASGLTPFKPNQSISRAEGVKIILEALEELGAMDLSSLSAGEPWYEPYMEVALDLNPHLTSETGGEGEHFIVTAEEALNPNTPLSRYDFMVMTGRVLSAVNCFAEQDRDGDGLSDYDEVTVYFTDPLNPDTDGGGIWDGVEISTGTNPNDRHDDDSDRDGLVNADETPVYRTDPAMPDTDGDGVLDGQEILRGTDPTVADAPVPSTEDERVFTDDELESSAIGDDNSTKGLEPGIYIVTHACNSCPCESSIENTADLSPGDTIFAAIMDAANRVALAVSNRIEVSELIAP